MYNPSTKYRAIIKLLNKGSVFENPIISDFRINSVFNVNLDYPHYGNEEYERYTFLNYNLDNYYYNSDILFNVSDYLSESQIDSVYEAFINNQHLLVRGQEILNSSAGSHFYLSCYANDNGNYGVGFSLARTSDTFWGYNVLAQMYVNRGEDTSKVYNFLYSLASSKITFSVARRINARDSYIDDVAFSDSRLSNYIVANFIKEGSYITIPYKTKNVPNTVLFDCSVNEIEDSELITSINTNLQVPVAAQTLHIPSRVVAETQNGSSLILDVENTQWRDVTMDEYVPASTVAKENNRYNVVIDVRSSDMSIQFSDSQHVSMYLNGSDASLYGFFTYVNEQNGQVDYTFNTGSTEDPYDGGGTSEPGGGDGNFDDTTDIVPEAALPTLGAVSSKMVTLWSPTQSEMDAITSYMNEDDIVTWLRNRFTSIKEAIITFGTMPLSGLISGTRSEFYFGSVIGSDVYATKLNKQYYSYSCGSLTVSEFWKSYLDYNPYTKVEISLPYVGIIPLDIDYIQAHTIEVVYHMDALSGAGQVLILANNTTLYRYPCNVMNQLPVTSTSHSVILNAVLSLTATAASIALTAGTGAAAGTGAVEQASNIIGIGASGVQDVMGSLKQHVNKSGSLSSNVGYLDEQTPYLIITRPRQCLPAKQHKYTGYPSLVTMTLGNCVGYTVVQDINLDNMSCTSDEANEIVSLLRSGVII